MQRNPSSLPVLLLALTLVLALLGPALIGQQRLAFRDVGHFYTPLYDYVSQRSAGGHLPLWNPLDHTGIPVAGESTTAIFYPPRIVFSVGLPTDVAMALYLALHLLLAAWGAGWAARAAGASAAGSSIAAIAYPFAGPVLFLYCNPPFLVGAAWLPIALAGSLRCLARGTARRIAVAALGLAMPVLGGDPQTTAHVLIVLGLGCAGRWLLRLSAVRCSLLDFAWPNRRRRRRKASLDQPRRRALSPRWLIAPLLAAGLAAPQLAASLDWARHSDRWFDRPPGVSRWWGETGSSDAAGPPLAWWQSPPAGTHAADIYAFSVAPWHWCELLVPAAAGQLFPEYRRLSSLLPDDGRAWTLTLYAGLLPLLAWWARLGDAWPGPAALWRRCGDRAAPRRCGRLDIWDAIAPLGLLFSLGAFGPAWGLRQLSQAVGLDGLADVNPAIFGPYWALVSCVPGYGSFRYPAKWLPWVSLGIAIAAARYVSRLNRRRRRKLVRLAWGAAAVSLLIAGATGPAAIRRLLLNRLPAALPADRFWGPLDADAALGMIAWSALHVAVVGLLIAGCLRVRWAGRDGRGPWRPSASLHGPWRHSASWRCLRPSGVTALVVVLAADLLVVGWPQIAMVDRSLEAALLQNGIHATELPAAGDAAWLRTRAGREWPAAWAATHSPRRMAEVEISQRRSLFARWHLDRQTGLFNGSVSITSQRYRSFWDAVHEITGPMSPDRQWRFWEAIIDWLGLQGQLSVSARPPESGPAADIPLQLVDIQAIPHADPLPTVRWHETWRSIPPRPLVTSRDWAARLDQIQHDPDAGPLVEGIVDSVQAAAPPSAGPPAPSSDEPFTGPPAEIQTLAQEEERIRLRVTAAAPGLLSLRRYQDGNWHCRYRGSPQAAWIDAPVVPVDYLAMGSLIPAGAHEVEFAYHPRWLTPSLLVMLCSALCLAWFLHPPHLPHLEKRPLGSFFKMGEMG